MQLLVGRITTDVEQLELSSLAGDGMRVRLATVKHEFHMRTGIARDLKHVSRGHRSYVSKGCKFKADVIIGDFSFFGDHCESYIVPLVVGNFVLVAGRTVFVGGDHEYRQAGTPSALAGRSTPRGVTLHDDCWIGFSSIILAGVTVGEGAVVAAGSVVHRDVDPYSIVGGNPAKTIKSRFATMQEEERHRAMLAEYRSTRTIPGIAV